MRKRTVLLHLALLALTVAGQDSICSIGGSTFTLRLIRFCLKSQFSIEQSLPEPTQEQCGLVCLSKGVKCQGFWLTGDNRPVCQTFEFDRCDHALIKANCSRLEWAFVKSQGGLPSGKLCPDGFGHSYRGSVYKMINVNSWTDGLNKCNSESGLTKFADAFDSGEVAHFQTLKSTLNGHLDSYMRSFYVGGFFWETFDPANWYWKDCNSTIVPEVWGPGEPNEYTDNVHTRANVWYQYSTGLDDEEESNSYIMRALCECVDPFYT